MPAIVTTNAIASERFAQAPREEEAGKRPAELFFAAFDGVCQHFALNPDHFPLEERVRALLVLWTKRMPNCDGGTP